MLTIDLKLLIIKYFSYNNIHKLCQISSICNSRSLWLTLLTTYNPIHKTVLTQDPKSKYLNTAAYHNYIQYEDLELTRSTALQQLDSEYQKQLELLKQKYNSDISQINKTYHNKAVKLFADLDQILRDLFDDYGYDNGLDPIVKNDIDKLGVVTSKNGKRLDTRLVSDLLNPFDADVIIIITNDKIIFTLSNIIDFDELKQRLGRAGFNVVKYQDYLKNKNNI